MTSNDDGRRVNLKLVLGVAGAMIGCGAVAAATRPSWIPVLLGRPTPVAAAPAPAPTQVATSQSKPHELPRAASRPRPSAPAESASSSPPVQPIAAVQQPAAAAPAPQYVLSEEWQRARAEAEAADLDGVESEQDLFERLMMGDQEAERVLALWCGAMDEPNLRESMIASSLKGLIVRFDLQNAALEGQATLSLVLDDPQTLDSSDAGDEGTLELFSPSQEDDTVDPTFQIVIDTGPSPAPELGVSAIKPVQNDPPAPPRR